MPGIPRSPNTAILNPAIPLTPIGAVTHRTIGQWAGDLSVLTRTRVPSCHYLVGKNEGQWAQLVPNNVTANHAAGANSWALGIEVSGQNGEPFTSWQLTACARIVNWLITEGISKNRYTGNERVARWAGFIDHAFIACEPKFRHYDYWNPRDWDVVAGTPSIPSLPSSSKGVLDMADGGTALLKSSLHTVWLNPADGKLVHTQPGSSDVVGSQTMRKGSVAVPVASTVLNVYADTEFRVVYVGIDRKQYVVAYDGQAWLNTPLS